MKLQEIAEACVRYWRQSNWLEPVRRFYATEAVSIEPTPWRSIPSEVVGREAILKKYDWVGGVLIHHSTHVDGPYFGANGQFSVRLEIDCTATIDGRRRVLGEIGLFSVRDGQVVREEYFYEEAEISIFRQLNESAGITDNE